MVIAAVVSAASAFRFVIVDSSGVEEEGIVEITTTGGNGCGMTDNVDVAMYCGSCAGATVFRLLMLYEAQ